MMANVTEVTAKAGHLATTDAQTTSAAQVHCDAACGAWPLRSGLWLCFGTYAHLFQDGLGIGIVDALGHVVNRALSRCLWSTRYGSESARAQRRVSIKGHQARVAARSAARSRIQSKHVTPVEAPRSAFPFVYAGLEPQTGVCFTQTPLLRFGPASCYCYEKFGLIALSLTHPTPPPATNHTTIPPE